jgi:acyl transferase domain-containing protein
MPDRGGGEGIAIIGMACRFPGGVDRPERLWQLLAEGRDAIEPVPQDRWPAHAWDDVAGALTGIGPATLRGGFLADLPDWDARFFGVSLAEARRMDPQHRMIMEVAWRAIEDACVGLDGLGGLSAGLFIGLSDSQEFSRLQHQCDPGCVDDPYMAPGASTSVVAGRLAAFLDARGPALAVDTACSSALVAMDLAMRSLAQHECDLAIVPAAAAVIHPESLVSAYQIGMLAPDGRGKAFDRKADGFVIGEGAGAVVLERAADAAANGHRIRAIAVGSAVNQNGRRATLAAPSMAAQAEVIRQALDRSRLAPAEISYIEAHAVGTVLGDAIELDALRKVFGPRQDDAPLHVGTVKPNLGHTLTAAGMASLIKAVLVLEHRRVPPTINLSDANPVARRTPWLRPAAESVALGEAPAPLVGVSSFGWSGINAHVVLRAAVTSGAGSPTTSAATQGGTSPGQAASVPRVLPLAAASPRALAVLAGELAAYLDEAGPPLADVARTLQARSGHAVRKALACVTTAEAAAACRALAGSAPVSPAGAGGRPVPPDMLDAVRRWEEGGDIAWPAADPGGGRLISLPPHPFERVRLWPVPAGQVPGPMSWPGPAMAAPDGAGPACATPGDVTPGDVTPGDVTPGDVTLGDGQPRPSLAAPYLPPRTPLEERIAELWQRHLDLAQVGIDDPFFELGGDSRLAVAIARLLQREVGSPLPASLLFENPTVRQLARALANDPARERPLEPDVVSRRRRPRPDAALAARRRQHEPREPQQ